MVEYIEKTLITTELPFVMMKYGNYFNERQIEKIVEIVYELVNSIEVADVQPVKRGRWDGYICSECNVYADYFISGDFYFDEKPNYCPNCGARMIKDGDTND